MGDYFRFPSDMALLCLAFSGQSLMYSCETIHKSSISNPLQKERLELNMKMRE